MADKRRMHTVPASYLEAFAVAEGRRTPAVWRYSRSDGEPVLIGIYDAAVWKDIYAFENETGQRVTGVEDTLAEVEGAFCEVRKALTLGAPLTIDQRMAVARFIAMQLLRTPRSLQLHRDAFARVMKDEVLTLAADKERFHAAMGDNDSNEACEAARQSLVTGGWHLEADGFTGLHGMMHGGPKIALWVTLMNWKAYTSDGTYLVMTSDNPVTLWAERAVAGQVGTEVGLGFADPAMRLSFPVTPFVSLVAEHTLFSLTAIHAEDLDGMHDRMRGWQPQLRYQGATPNRLKVLNHATVANADRYVFHCERDAKVDRFLARYLLHQPAPVRRYDLKTIGSPS
jgi:Protein of unknown function (DUF4238)